MSVVASFPSLVNNSPLIDAIFLPTLITSAVAITLPENKGLW